MVDHRETESLAHELESYLRRLRYAEGDAALTSAGMDLLIRLPARSRPRLLRGAPTNRRATLRQWSPKSRPSIARDGADATAPAVEVRAAANWLCVFTPSPALIARGVNVDSVRARLREHGEIISAEPIITPQGAVAFQFEINGQFSAELIAQWQPDGLVLSPITAAEAAAALETAAEDERAGQSCPPAITCALT